MSCLDSPAPELIQKIGTELGNNVTELRLVCRRMSSVLESHILRSITIDITKNRLDVGISQLTTLATQGHSAATATHELYIRNLCPSRDPSDCTPSWEFDTETEEWVKKAPTPDPPGVKIAEEKMQATLRVAIASLSNLRSLKWNIGGHDLKWTSATVMEAAKTLPLLESLELDLEGGNTADLQLESLRNLQSIKIRGYSSEFFKNIVEPLSLLIANSPNLHALHVGPTYSGGKGPSASFHQFLKHCPASIVLPLKHLGLQGFSIKFDNITLPHLPHLTSLTLLNITKIDFDTDSDYTDSDTESDTEGTIDKAEISHPDEIWATLKMINVRLDEISVNHICTALLDYISSYSGLKKLHLAPVNFSAQGESDLAASRFYDRSLGKHMSSLEELSVVAGYEGEWCLGDRALMVISQCTKLKILEGSLVSISLGEPKDNAVKSLIDVTTQLPLLEKLNIRAANLEHDRRACGTSIMGHLRYVRSQLSKCIREYEATGSSKPVPLIIVDSRKFVTMPNESAGSAGGAWKYQCDSGEPEEDYYDSD